MPPHLFLGECKFSLTIILLTLPREGQLLLLGRSRCPGWMGKGGLDGSPLTAKLGKPRDYCVGTVWLLVFYLHQSWEGRDASSLLGVDRSLWSLHNFCWLCGHYDGARKKARGVSVLVSLPLQDKATNNWAMGKTCLSSWLWAFKSTWWEGCVSTCVCVCMTCFRREIETEYVSWNKI